MIPIIQVIHLFVFITWRYKKCLHVAHLGSSYQFTGYKKDPETGYNYYGARYYSDRLGIWLSVDPPADKYPGLSPYAYCANNPIMRIDPDGKQAVAAMGDPPKWASIPSVIPKNKFIGWGYNGSKNCFTLANFQLAVVGYNTTSKYYQAYTEQKGVNKEQTHKAIEYITTSLTEGMPVMVGVDNHDGNPGNSDKTTDHWIVIVGMDSDDKGNYFNFYDNATSNQEKGTSAANKLYYDAESGKITGTADNAYSRNSQRDYTVTRVKETQQNPNANQKNKSPDE